MRVLVTGATGFLGSHTVHALIEQGHEVVGAVRHPELGQKLSLKAKFISCDFRKDTEASIWIPRLKDVDVVVNAVALSQNPLAGLSMKFI